MEPCGTIRGLCVVKNEADIIKSALRDALSWCDRIFVLDNGSTDGTWQILQELAAITPAVVLLGRHSRPFGVGIRSEIFNAARAGAKAGDWWCRLDADEFYIDDPRTFLSEVPRRFGIVWSASVAYYFTDEDAARYRADPSHFSDSTPVQERLRYYLCHWSEIRFMRHHRRLSWPHGSAEGWPENMGSLLRHYPLRRIKLRHYAYRSPAQIEQRLVTRSTATRFGSFKHERWRDWAAKINPAAIGNALAESVYEDVPSSWESRIVPAEHLDYDYRDQRYVIREELMPDIPKNTWRNELAVRVKRPVMGLVNKGLGRRP